MNRAEEKATRLLQIEQLLWAHPEGLTRAEIARRLGVDRSVITKYLNKGNLPPSIYEDEFDGNKLKVDRSADLTKTAFSLHEVLAIHLATRLLATRFDKYNPHAASALRKLGKALQRLDRNVSQHLLRSADVMDEESAFRDPVYLDVLEKLTVAWSAGCKVKITHRMPDGWVADYVLAPYFIEPYAVGQTAHVIGLREPPGVIRTLKIERIRSAEITGNNYVIPDDFDSRALLRDAWGIWYTDDEPQKVVLRFHPRVVPRVKESRWHVSQELAEQPDGYLVWTAHVAEPQEMLPWIRGWGADVEVLEPKELREALQSEARRLARLYGVTSSTQDPTLARILRCWGKTGKTAQDFHPAVFHMLDAGHVARELLSEQASPRWRHVLANALNADADTLTDWLPWLVAMHDIGKISSAFQAANEEQKNRLKTEGFSFGHWQRDVQHATISQLFVQDELSSLLNLPSSLQGAWAESIGGHHGQFLSSSSVADARRKLRADNLPEWGKLRADAAQILKEHLLKQSPTSWQEPTNVSAATMALAGFTILCDWLGSDSLHFPPRPELDLDEYAQESAQKAHQAVESIGFFQASQSAAPISFPALFLDLRNPRPLQKAIDDIPAEFLAGSCLAIIEAPTGEGKTEAALALAHRLAQATGSDEMYYALPTMATSNQMFGRLQQHVRDRLGLPAQTKLVHGQAFLVEDDLLIEPLGNGDNRPSDALEWFGPKKRALLAPLGVGTIDQAELAALNVKHTALRMIGLAGKGVIIDEVHAYDTYMTTIIERLLEWLAVMGTSVILLSATLPQSRRADLTRAYGFAGDMAPEDESAYPSLWLIGRAGSYHTAPPAQQPNRRLQVHALQLSDDEPEAKARWLLSAVADGGCVCWMTNTVERAQKMFDAVDRLAPPDVDCLLLHARFPLEDRQKLEAELAQKYGLQGTRPTKGIVIGTQVLEQSLDLDFDMMVSDLAPIDLLLQRAGRLHRHDRQRASAHHVPRLWINTEAEASDGLKLSGADQAVYDEFILRQTWQVLQGRDEIVLPADYRPLIEAVYGATEPAPGSPLSKAWKKLQDKQAHAAQEANLRLLPAPKADESFCGAAARLQFEEDENSAGWIVAQTRLGEESVTAIPLERDGDQACFAPDGRVSLNAAAPREIQLRLLRRSLRISNYEAVQALKAQADSLPRLFTASALLKECLPLWLEDGRAILQLAKGKLNLMLDPKLGLVIAKDKGG